MRLFTIEENDANQRLDRFLKKLFPNATSSLIYKINRKNKVKVNGKKEDNEYKLQSGDEIKIYLPENDFIVLSQKKEQNVKEFQGKFERKNIVYEDGDILVVNKDFGLNVHPGDYKTKESNLISQVQDYLGEKLHSLTFKPSLIHRIDRDTSGIILIAKKKYILDALSKDFRKQEKIQKIYHAFVIGKLPYSRGKIDKKLLRIENAKNENKVQVSEKGQEALTYYKVLKEYTLQTPHGDLLLSELEVEIVTGRMHQIRVHLASIGNPIIGDNVYGEKVLNYFFQKYYGISRQLLHAWKLGFFHYGKQKDMLLEANFKEDLTKFKNKL